VQLELESQSDFEQAAKNPKINAGQKVHVETHGVVFNRATGLARTDQPVKFVFPDGNGQAVGVEYRSEEGTVRLLRDVQLFLKPQSKDVSSKKSESLGTNAPVRVTGRSLDFERDSRTMQLYGPVEVATRIERMHAGKLTLTLDAGFHAEKLVAAPGLDGKNPEMESQGADGPANLS